MKLQKTALPMGFTVRFLHRNATACALFALATLTAYSQAAPEPETHGIVVANMDRSVKPGDDFYRYANGDWIKRTEIPKDRNYIECVDTASMTWKRRRKEMEDELQHEHRRVVQRMAGPQRT